MRGSMRGSMVLIGVMVFGISAGCDEPTDAVALSDLGVDALSDDFELSNQPDIGENCVLVRDETGEWVSECPEFDQAAPADIGQSTELSVSIATPSNGTVYSEGEPIGISGSVVATNVELAFVAVEISVAGGTNNAITFDRESGLFSAVVAGLPPGEHRITFTARAAPDLEVSGAVTVTVDCGFFTAFSEPLDPGMWRVLGSASLDERGWLEMSNNQTSTSGGIFLTGRTIDPGSLDVSFRMSTGASQCPDPDQACSRPDGMPYEISDGFAVTFWNVAADGVDDLWDALCRCGSGAVTTASILADQGLTEAPEGITIEFDSYPNACPNNGFFDPVQAPHVEILQNGRYFRGPEGLTREERCMLMDFSQEEGLTWASYPEFTDNFWHDVELSIRAGGVKVYIDGGLVLDAELPDFQFKGGVLAFSGGSGAVPSYQRFDELSVQSGCQ